MPIKLYDSLDEIPETLREAAVETKDGKFAAEERDEINVVKGTLDKERKRASDAEKALRDAEAERDRLRTEREARSRGATEEEIERRRKEIDDAVKPHRERADSAEAKLRKVLHVDRVRAMALTAGILPDRIEDAMLILERRTDLTDDEKGLVVKDKDGNVSATRVEDFLEREFKAEKPWLYAATGTTGSGARQSTGTPATRSDQAARAAEQRAAQQRAEVSSAF